MRKMVALDVETTGLVPDRHHVWEVSWIRADRGDVANTLYLPHDVTKADEKALEVNRYWERFPDGAPQALNETVLNCLVEDLTDAVVIGANPSFDLAFLRYWMEPVWHHRLVDVEVMAMVMLGVEAPLSLEKTVDALNSQYDANIIHLPDHTSAGDARAALAVHDAVTEWRGYVGRVLE